VEPDDFGAFHFFGEVAIHGVLDHGTQIIPIFALRKNAMPKRARPKAALIGFMHFKNNLAHSLSLADGMDFDKAACAKLEW
jgi:hypothetical protein